MNKPANDNDDIRIAEIKRLITEFNEKFKSKTTDPDDFITISEIEQLWGELQNKTNNIYSDMVRELMSSVNEKEIIRKKKENTKPKE